VAAVERLSEGERPDVFLAEPVGSCTDLMATVLLPLAKVYRLPLRLAPLSVLLDGERAYRTLVSRGRARDFSKDVGYIYRKQIEEAEMVVINKIDLLTAGQLAKLRAQLEREYPGRRVFEMSAHGGGCRPSLRNGGGGVSQRRPTSAPDPSPRQEGFDAWLEAILDGESEPRRIVEIDYRRYGVGEALLGWLNATVSIGRACSNGAKMGTVLERGRPPPQRGAGEVARAPDSFDGAALLHTLTHAVVDRLERERIRIAHFKMILTGDEGSSLRVQVTREGEKPQFAGALDGAAMGAKLLINLRAEGDPERLAEAVRVGLGTVLEGVAHTVEEFAHFRPGQPKPTHRIAELVG
jgi:hypothetical protein